MKKLIVIVAMLALCGCQEQWGRGDPDEVWQGYFGNSNNSRLNFKQNNVINDHAGKINKHTEVITKLYEEVVRIANKVHDLEARPVYDPNEFSEAIKQAVEKRTDAFDLAVVRAFNEK